MNRGTSVSNPASLIISQDIQGRYIYIRTPAPSTTPTTIKHLYSVFILQSFFIQPTITIFAQTLFMMKFLLTAILIPLSLAQGVPEGQNEAEAAANCPSICPLTYDPKCGKDAQGGVNLFSNHCNLQVANSCYNRGYQEVSLSECNVWCITLLLFAMVEEANYDSQLPIGKAYIRYQTSVVSQQRRRWRRWRRMNELSCMWVCIYLAISWGIS